VQIEDAILKETGNQTEKVVVLGPRGEVLFTRTGRVGEVGFTQTEMNTLRGRSDLLTHNHPSGGGIGAADFDIAADLNVRELHAFGDQYRYRLLRIGSAWPDHQRALDELSRIRAAVRRHLSARVAAGTLTPEEYSLRYWHDVWTRYSRRHSEVIYVRERRKR
jgi:hypothetical protein